MTRIQAKFRSPILHEHNQLAERYETKAVPINHYYRLCMDQWAKAFLGAKRTRALMNLNAIYQTGANVTLSSDWNVHSINPLEGIANSLIMGKTGLPSITAAIDAYTINAAYSLGIDKITGSIEVGKSADFAILDNDITQIPLDRISSSKVILTILQGEIVFEK